MNLVELRNISKSFPEGLFGKRTVLKNIDLTVRQGDFIVLRGANGAGKSTLIKIILGLQEADRGTVKLFGGSPMLPESRLHLGTVFQEVTPPNNLKVRELINLVRSYYPNPKSTIEILQMVGLLDKQHAYPSDLAGGQKQRLYFAIALVGNPKLLILDEPTKNLDIEGQDAFWSQVEHCKQNGVTILMITHIKSEQDKLQSLATHIITLSEGKLVYDKQPEPLEEVAIEPTVVLSSEAANPVKMFISQTWAEVLQLMRTPMYLAGILIFSALFAVIPNDQGDMVQKGLVFFSAICLLIFSIDRLGKRIAIERVEGWLKLIRVTPLRPGIYIAAKLAMTMLILMISLATIISIGIFKFEIEHSAIEWARITTGLLLGIIPFTMIGITLGYIIPPKALDSVAGLLLPIAMFCSGEIPLPSQDYLQDAIVLSPFFHYNQLIKLVAGIEYDDQLLLHITWLLFYGVLLNLLAKFAYQKNAAAK